MFTACGLKTAVALSDYLNNKQHLNISRSSHIIFILFFKPPVCCLSSETKRKRCLLYILFYSVTLIHKWLIHLVYISCKMRFQFPLLESKCTFLLFRHEKQLNMSNCENFLYIFSLFYNCKFNTFWAVGQTKTTLIKSLLWEILIVIFH